MVLPDGDKHYHRLKIGVMGSASGPQTQDPIAREKAGKLGADIARRGNDAEVPVLARDHRHARALFRGTQGGHAHGGRFDDAAQLQQVARHGAVERVGDRERTVAREPARDSDDPLEPPVCREQGDAFPLIAEQIERETGWSRTSLYGAATAGLLFAALASLCSRIAASPSRSVTSRP